MTDLIVAYPEVEQFKKLKAIFTLVKNVSEDTPLKIFKEHVVRHFREYILNRDETFFMTFEGYHENLKSVSNHADYWYEFIVYLKQMWETMSKENKDAIWNHLVVLIMISDKL